jgi:hypothetical protein
MTRAHAGAGHGLALTLALTLTLQSPEVEYRRSATTCASDSMPRRATGRRTKSARRMPCRSGRMEPSAARSRRHAF